MKIGFMGRTKMLSDTINLVVSGGRYDVAFVWTSKDESYYEFGWRNFETIANEIGCPFIYSPSVDNVKRIPDADVVVSVNFVNLIPDWFLRKFESGVLNAHAGDLPRYKGNACPNWAILNNENAVTVTVHKMEEAVDSGPIFCQSKFDLKDNTYIGDVYSWLSSEVPKLFLEALDKIENGILPVPQAGRTLRTFPRRPDDSQLDFSKGLDWNHRLIRASSEPFDGAFCYLNDSPTKVLIWRAKPVNLDFDFYAVNGQVICRNKDDQTFLVAIENKALCVEKFSIEGVNQDEAFDLVCGSLRNRLR